MRQLFCRIVLIAGVLAAVDLPAGGELAPSARYEQPQAVRLGILSTIGELSSTQVFAETIEALQKAWNRRVEITHYDLDTLPQAVVERRLDYFIANAGTFSQLQTQGLARHLATRKIARADDPNFSMGGVFFVKSDNTAIREVEDMRGRPATAVARNAFGGFNVLLGELLARGFDPDDFFGSIVFTGYPMQNVFDRVRQSKAQIGMVRACLLEEMIAEGLVGKDEFRVIGARDEPHLRCLTSTALYPDWVFAATAEAKPELSRRASAALFSMPENSQVYWSIASDFTRIDSLFKDLRIGHYSYLREWTFRRLWQEYRPLVIGALGVFFLIVWHAVFVTFEVRRKTASLRAVMREREQAQNEVLQTQSRLQSLERASLVGMLSNMVAHELKQPLGAIANFADGIRTFAAKSEESDACEGKRSDERRMLDMIGAAAEEIIGQTQRASAIIERVRGYAKNGATKHSEKLLLHKVVQDAVRDFRLLAKDPAPIIVTVPANAYAQADPVELSLVILNLFKNASEALRKTAQPVIEVRLDSCGSMWELSVADNGPTMDVSAFQDLFAPKISAKSSGLGVGLAISARIMESCGGRLRIERNQPFGLKAVMTLPKA